MIATPQSATLIPPPGTARAEPRRRLAGAFGPRFFLLLVVGLVWLGAAFHDSRFYYALAAWDGIVIVAWILDLVRLPKPKQLTITRRWNSAAALSVPNKIELILENSSRVTLIARLIDNIPPHLRQDAPELSVTRWGTVRVDHKTMMTSLDGVFAAGDIVRGASLVVWAVRDGRDVSDRMHEWLKVKAKRAKVAA